MVTIFPLTEQDVAMFQPLYKHHIPIGWFREDGAKINRLILKMKPGQRGWTPTHCARDCGDHYIIARYDRYDRIDKSTHAMIKGVEDR